MGRKVHPIGFRLNINQPWLGRWYAEGKEYSQQLDRISQSAKLYQPKLTRLEFQRSKLNAYPGKLKVSVHTAKPGILIGRKGEELKNP